MKANLYQELTRRTRKGATGEVPDMVNALFGIIGEKGEIVDRLKKIVFHDHPLDSERDKLKEEIGDLLWYVAWMADEVDVKLEDVFLEVSPLRIIPDHVPTLVYVAFGLSRDRFDLIGRVEDFLLRGYKTDAFKNRVAQALENILFFAFMLAAEIGVEVSEIMAANIRKLEERYPNGFESERSIKRGAV